jgi:hypothetical protein
MNNQQNQVSSKTQRHGKIAVHSLTEKVIMQLMTFNKCTRERAVCMYKEMLQTIADYYLLEQVSSKTQGRIEPMRTSQEIEVFATDVCNAYGLIETHTNQLTKQLC